MIVCKIELWPRGDAARKRTIGEVRIANVGGDSQTGHYRVELFKSADYARRTGVANLPRLKLGPYDLLLRALAAVIGPRNPIEAKIADAGGAEILLDAGDVP